MPKVLIIDDDPDLRRMVSRILHGAGQGVIEAQDWIEGILRFGAEHPDIVITDIAMPGKGEHVPQAQNHLWARRDDCLYQFCIVLDFSPPE
jgi:CheY-like chemotaxis protein